MLRAVVEIIDEASLQCGKQVAVAERGEHEDFPGSSSKSITQERSRRE
jgi:hypothetical protein